MNIEENLEKANYQKRYQSFYNDLNNYLENFIIPDVIAFYLFKAYKYNCLGNHDLNNHLNSALMLFNANLDINDIFPLIKQTLLIKYNLKITNENPLILEEL